MWPILGGLISGAASLFGGMQTNQQSAENVAAQNAAQMQQVQQQEQFQAQMSNTAYQRASADMKAAGLNPMMMFGSGSAASSPQGAQAQIQRPSYQSPVTSLGDVVNSTISNAVQMKTMDKMTDEIANLRTTNSLIQANTAESVARSKLTGATTALQQAALPAAQFGGAAAKDLGQFAVDHPDLFHALVVARYGMGAAKDIVGGGTDIVGGLLSLFK